MSERRKLEEILARYDLEPELQDVYVEGSFDKEVLSRCFKKANHTDRIVYEIDSVEITAEALMRQGLTEGNKQRIIALSRALDNLQREFRCRCLVDRDLDHWFGSLERNRALVWTEYCSIELYFLTHEALHDLLCVAAKARIEDLNEFVESLATCLIDLYTMRLADRDLKWLMDWLPTAKHLKASGSSVLFDSEEYAKRLLMKNGRFSQFEIFIEARRRWRSRLTGDARNSARGHDLVEVLAWVVRAFGGIKEFASTLAIERMFLLIVPKIDGLMSLFPLSSEREPD
ncbi:hypothetical protein DYQ86_26150 [Acidobacteria bacterium AB60]|nr:hypothetical protein DYQ86_26150 [Acidobacteria bacterium AB60]